MTRPHPGLYLKLKHAVSFVCVACFALVASVSCRLNISQPVSAAPAFVDCEPGREWEDYLLPTPPPGGYYYSKTYGWFDPNHFDTGNPRQIIEDVRTAATRGGGVISIRQGVREGITGYTGHYLVSGEVSDEEVIGVALGVYMDWSTRFEDWQGRPPRNMAGPLTAFAIEDLPSHYVGFFAVANGTTVAEIFACYLGGVEATDMKPPHFLFFDNNNPDSTLPPTVQRLVNMKFTPMVQTEEGWRNVPWPGKMQMVPIDSSSGRWQFEQEETWYFNK